MDGGGGGDAGVEAVMQQCDGKQEDENRIPSLGYLNLEGDEAAAALAQSLPKVLSNPEISDHIRYYDQNVIKDSPVRIVNGCYALFRPGLEPSMVQHAAFDEYAYDVDLSRNVASKQKICDNAQDKLNVNSLTLLGAPDQSNMYRSMPVRFQQMLTHVRKCFLNNSDV